MADYNLWANKKLCGWLAEISDDQWNQPIVSSFNSIRETVLHMCGAESVWVERMNKVTSPSWAPSTFKGSKDEHISLLISSSESLKEFTAKIPESVLNSLLFFRRLNGEENMMPYYQILAHVFNHSTYHRGQLVTMLRQAGFTTVGSTDLSVYFKSVATESNAN